MRLGTGGGTGDAHGGRMRPAVIAFLLGCATNVGGGPGPGPDPDPDPDLDPDPDPAGTCPDFEARFEQVRARFAEALSTNSVPGGAIAVVCGGAVRSAGVGVLRL